MPTNEEIAAFEQQYMPREPSFDERMAAFEQQHAVELADPEKVEIYRKMTQRLSETPPLGLGEHAAASEVPEEDRDLFLKIAADQYKADQTMKEAGFGARWLTSAVQGLVTDVGVPLAKRIPGSPIPDLSPEQERFRQQLMQVREGIDPTVRPDTPAIGRWAQQATRSAYPMIHAVAGSKGLGGAAKVAGLGAKGIGLAEAAGVSGSFLPQMADQTYSDLIGEGMDPDTAGKITAVSAPIEAAIEAILPDPLSGYAAAFRGTVRQVAGKLLVQHLANFGKEWSEEGLQALTHQTALEVGRRLDEEIPNLGLDEVGKKAGKEFLQAFGPTLMLMAPGAAIGTAANIQESASRPERLARLRALRDEKPFITVKDVQDENLTPEEMKNRRTRKKAIDDRIRQLEEEEKNASQVPTQKTENDVTGNVGREGEEGGGDRLRSPGEDTGGTQPPGQGATAREEVQDVKAAAAKDLAKAPSAVRDALKQDAQGVITGVQTRMDYGFDEQMQEKGIWPNGDEVYGAFEATREALRTQYGDAVTLHRLQGTSDLIKNKHTLNWVQSQGQLAAFEEMYEGEGREHISREIPVDDIVAVYVGESGNYEEFIVLNKGSKGLRLPASHPEAAASKPKNGVKPSEDLTESIQKAQAVGMTFEKWVQSPAEGRASSSKKIAKRAWREQVFDKEELRRYWDHLAAQTPTATETSTETPPKVEPTPPPKVEPISPPVQKKRVGALKKRPGSPVTVDTIKKTFPGAKVSEGPKGFNVEVGDSYFTIQVTDEMPEVDWDAAEAGLGRKISPEERERIGVAGATSVEFPDGTKHDGLGLILLHESLADDTVLRHEALHLARQAGIISKAEWDALVREHAKGEKDANVQEERIAQAMENAKVDRRVLERIRSWIRRMLANLGITEYQARDVHQLLNSSGFWARAGYPLRDGSRYALRGRPDLANPATDSEVRKLVDDVDEARKQRGLPKRRSDADVDRQADARLAADYEGERDKLIQAGRSGQQLLDVDTNIGKKILNREATEALQSGNGSKIAEAMAIIESYRNTGSEQGRAFRQRQDPIETPAERMARTISEAILEPPQKQREKRNKLRREGQHAEADKINRKWAEEAKDLKDKLKALGVDLDDLWEGGYSKRRAAGVLATIQHVKATGWDKAYEYWRNSILSLPTTQSANLFGNVGHAAWHFTAERLTESLVNVVVGKKDAAQLGEFKHLLSGMIPGMSEGARNFLTTWNTETPIFEARIGKEGQWRIEDPHTAIGGMKGRIIRMPQRLLLAVDDFAKTMFTRMEVGAHAYRIAKAEGLSGKKLANRMHELTLDEESAAWDSAYDSALELTFQQEGGEIAQKIKRNVLAGRRDIPGLRYIIPFVTTPINIFSTGIRKSPLGAARSLKAPLKMYENYQDGKHVLNGVVDPQAIAEQMLAWALVLALLSNDEDDPWITGSEPASDYEKRQASYRTIPAQSVVIGDRAFSYSRLEPFATAIALTVDFVNAIRSGDTARQVEVPLTSLKGQIGGKTFLSGMADILDAVQEEETSKGIARWFSNFTVSWVPNLVRGMGREASNYYENRSVWGTRGEWFSRLGKRTLQKTELPFGIPEYPIYDVWGRPATRSETGLGPATDWLYRITIPVRTQKNETFFADRLILNYNNRHPEDEKLPLAPSKYFYDKGKTRYMTDAQYAELAKLTGETYRASLDGIEFDVDNPTIEAVNWINDAGTEARSTVRDLLKKRWAGENVDIEPAALGKKIRDIMLQKVAGTLPDKPRKGTTESDMRAAQKEVKRQLDMLGKSYDDALALLRAYYKSHGWTLSAVGYKRKKRVLQSLYGKTD